MGPGMSTRPLAAGPPADPASRTGPARRLLLPVLVFACACAAFLPALEAGFVKWDDDINFLDHEAWRGLSSRHLAWMFTTFHNGPYQPLAWVTLGLDHASWGMDPFGYHLTSLLFHGATAVAVFLLSRRLLAIASPASSARIDAAASLAAVLFAVHPLRAESVAWITERRDVVSGVLLVLALHAWVGYARDPRAQGARGRYAWSLGLFAASLLAKGIGMTLPLLMLVLDRFPLRRGEPVGRLVAEKVPFLMLSAIAAILAWVGQSQVGAPAAWEGHGLPERLAQACFGLAFYARKSLLPTGLSPLYPLHAPIDPLATRFVLSAAAVIAGATAAFLLRRRLPALGAALAAYAILLLPVLGLAQVGPQLVADRYSYLPAIPLALLVAGVVLRLGGAGTAIGLAAVAALAAPTWRQAAAWKDTITLWTRAVEADPLEGQSRRKLVLALTEEAARAGDPAESTALLERALEACAAGLALAPDPFFASHAARVHSLLAEVRPERAEEHLERALEFTARAVELGRASAGFDGGAYLDHGLLLCRLRRFDEAAQSFRELVERDPEDMDARMMLAQSLIEAGRVADAVEHLEKLRTTIPEHPTVWIEIGRARRLRGERELSQTALRRALQLLLRALGPEAERSSEYQRAVQELKALASAPEPPPPSPSAPPPAPQPGPP